MDQKIIFEENSGLDFTRFLQHKNPDSVHNPFEFFLLFRWCGVDRRYGLCLSPSESEWRCSWRWIWDKFALFTIPFESEVGDIWSVMTAVDFGSRWGETIVFWIGEYIKFEQENDFKSTLLPKYFLLILLFLIVKGGEAHFWRGGWTY